MQRYGNFFDFGYKFDIFSVYIRFSANTIKSVWRRINFCVK